MKSNKIGFVLFAIALIGIFINSMGDVVSEQQARSAFETLRSEIDVLKRKLKTVKRELKLQSRYKKVTVTGYPPLPEYTNDDSETTASGEKVRLGRVAVCPNMIKEGWTFGRKIYLKGAGIYDGIYTINDRMGADSKYYEKCVNRIDIFQWTLDEAKKIYFKNAEIVLLGEPA